jgi:hypothetical protein
MDRDGLVGERQRETHMGKFRVTFSTPQRVMDVMPSDVLVTEVVVEADRLVLLRDDGVQMDVSPDVVASAGAVLVEPTQEAGGKKQDRPENEGKPWGQEEIAELLTAWESGITNTRELAERHGRSSGAIRSRLKLLGLV